MGRMSTGADNAALDLKAVLIERLEEKGYEVEDRAPRFEEEARKLGADHPEVARVGHDRAILCRGTGLGMSITANKVPGVRAAERARKNKAQVLTMGRRVIGLEAAKMVMDAWLDSEFAGGSSAKKVEKTDRCYYDAAASTLRMMA